MVRGIGDLWSYRRLIYDFAKRELRLRYAGSTLGRIWLVLNPMLQVTLYTFVFSLVLKTKFNHGGLGDSRFSFPVFICCGILIWNFFSKPQLREASFSSRMRSLLRSSTFPKECCPFPVVLAAFFYFATCFIVFVPFLFLIRVPTFADWMAVASATLGRSYWQLRDIFSRDRPSVL